MSMQKNEVNTRLQDDHFLHPVKIFFISFCIMFCFMAVTANMARAQELPTDQMQILKKLDVFAPLNFRGPNNFVPNDEVISGPHRKSHWGEKILVEDDNGVLLSVRQRLQEWREKEEYYEQWNLQSTGMYQGPEHEEKVDFLKKKALKYLDKRITGEVKKAPEGSTLAKIGKVQQALKPAAKVSIAPRTKLRFKGRLMQGHTILKVENPFLESEVNYLIFKDRLDFKVGKDYEDWGLKSYMIYEHHSGQTNYILGKDFKGTGYSALVNYDYTEKKYRTDFDKRLNENWTTGISSIQNDNAAAFSGNANKIIRINFSSHF